MGPTTPGRWQWVLPTCRSWLADHRASGLFSKDFLRKSLKSSDLWNGPHEHRARSSLSPPLWTPQTSG